jgi:hypothetical protein
MENISDPIADNIFDAVSSDISAKGVVDIKPTTDENWAKIRIGAITLAEGPTSSRSHAPSRRPATRTTAAARMRRIYRPRRSRARSMATVSSQTHGPVFQWSDGRAAPGRQAAASIDGQVSQAADRLASTRARRAAGRTRRQVAGRRVSRAEVHLVRRLSPKRRVRHAVVFRDVALHQPTDGRDAVERVAEEPLMLRRSYVSAITSLMSTVFNVTPGGGGFVRAMLAAASACSFESNTAIDTPLVPSALALQ